MWELAGIDVLKYVAGIVSGVPSGKGSCLVKFHHALGSQVGAEMNLGVKLPVGPSALVPLWTIVAVRLVYSIWPEGFSACHNSLLQAAIFKLPFFLTVLCEHICKTCHMYYKNR
jgi:hypothetical protein